MNRIVLKGPAADVRWSYRKAAELRSWTLTAEPSGTQVTADVVTHDAYALTQSALTFVVPREKGQWRWPIVTCQLAGTTFTATLGTQE